MEDGELEQMVRLPRSNKGYATADFIIDEGFLKLVRENHLTKKVPKSQRQNIVEEAHEGTMAGHFNARKLYRILKKVVLWDGYAERR